MIEHEPLISIGWSGNALERVRLADGRTLIAVTLNSRLHFSDATKLLDFGFARKPD